jgi:hypothetical protein
MSEFIAMLVAAVFALGMWCAHLHGTLAGARRRIAVLERKMAQLDPLDNL